MRDLPGGQSKQPSPPPVCHLGQRKEDMRLDITYLWESLGWTSISREPVFLKKPMAEVSARLQLLPTKSPRVAAALSSGRNWKHSPIPAFGPVTGVPKRVRTAGSGILNIAPHRPQQNQAKLWGCGHTGWADPKNRLKWLSHTHPPLVCLLCSRLDSSPSYLSDIQSFSWSFLSPCDTHCKLFSRPSGGALFITTTIYWALSKFRERNRRVWHSFCYWWAHNLLWVILI